jgi:uncharacterized phage protein gp47/JayE
MSFAAEPYGTFVDDLLANLTGGVSRVRFRFVDEELPFRLAAHERFRADSLRVHGLAGGAFTAFVVGRDLDVADDGTLAWRESEPGVPAAGAVWPDPGTDVWVGFDVLPGGPAPLLNDRNPGSVVRTLAEAFAREYAVLSLQLDGVYRAAFVDTAGGRDLEQIGALVGVQRRGSTHARGEVVMRRGTAAPADIVVVAGTLVSTATSPAVTVETTQTATLRRGTVSVALPVRAVAPGPAGVAPARGLTVLHRPIFGVESVLNPEPMTFGGGAESDEELRARIVRALEVAGRSTVGALRGALGAIEGIREQDVLVEEDHLAFPGLIQVTVAADIDQETAAAAVAALEATRPAGVRVVHNLQVPSATPVTLATDTGGGGDAPVGGAPASGVTGDVFQPLAAVVTVTPGDSGLPQDRKDALTFAVRAAVTAAVDAVGVGEPLIYNRVVAALMAVDGVLDAVLEIGPVDGPLARANLRPLAARTRPTLADEDLTVRLRGERVVVDLAVTVERRGLAASAQATAALAAARADVEQRLAAALQVTPAELSPAVLLGLLPATEEYAVEALSYRVELLDEGLRVTRQDAVVPLDPGQQIWVRSVAVTEETVTS